MSNGSAVAPIRVFFSYAHEDAALRNALEEQLAILRRQGTISTWHDRKIGAGREWAGAISDELEAAHIILLLVSPAFLASDYCYDREMTRALERHEREEAIVIPIVLRPVSWEGAPFGKLQALPTDARPVTKWGNRDEALADVARGIAKEVARLAQASSVIPAARPALAPTERPRDERTEAQRVSEVLRHMKFATIQSGSFLMGSQAGEENEQPQHEVRISRPFQIAAYVVTQRQWKGVMGTEPWRGREFVRFGDDYPAVYVSWNEAKAFIARLNTFDPSNYYRLPAEAEWEYSVRAGTSSKFSFGDEEQAFNAYGWFKGNSFDAGYRHPHEVGQKRPNAWGLYDAHGNVWEWVEDWYYGSYAAQQRPDPDEKVLRGGGYDFSPNGARSAFRNHLVPTRSAHVIGFRVVREAVDA